MYLLHYVSDVGKELTPEVKLTVPKKIRDLLKFEEGQALTFFTIGDFVIISPKRVGLDEARRQIRRIVKESGLSEAGILLDLKTERAALYRDKYGRKQN